MHVLPHTHTHGPCRRTGLNGEDTRTTAESSYTRQLRVQDYSIVTAQHKNCGSRAVDDCPGRDSFRGLKRSPVSQPRALGLQRSCSDGKAGSNFDENCIRTGVSLLQLLRQALGLLARDWSKFQFLRSWFDPAEIRNTPPELRPIRHDASAVTTRPQGSPHQRQFREVKVFNSG